MKVSTDFFVRKNTLLIARQLIGKKLVVPNRNGRRVSGMIVEVEAYLGKSDRAAHSYNGRRTKRNEPMYSAGGTVYVFFVYGMYYQLNVVTGPVDYPHAILIRAVEPLEGLDIMKRRRKLVDVRNLTSGPGKLCIAFGIDQSFSGLILGEEKIWIEDGRFLRRSEIESGARIGIDYAGEDVGKPWRFWLKGNEFVSRR